MMDTGKKIKDELSLESVSIAQPSTAANLFAYDDSSPSSTMSDDEDDESCTTDIDDVVFPLSGASTDIEAEIARDLNEISLKEREDTLYDIHGVADVIEEEPKFINDALRELDSWLSKKRRNTKISKAYEIAAAQSPVFVERKGFRLMFLRANRFNSQAAATQMLKHFEVKLDLFGAELLCKDIRIADLNEEGSESLRQLKLTFLPKRDSAGRLVVVIIEHLASHCSIKSMVSVLFLSFFFFFKSVFVEQFFSYFLSVPSVQIQDASVLVSLYGETR